MRLNLTAVFTVSEFKVVSRVAPHDPPVFRVAAGRPVGDHCRRGRGSAPATRCGPFGRAGRLHPAGGCSAFRGGNQRVLCRDLWWEFDRPRARVRAGGQRELSDLQDFGDQLCCGRPGDAPVLGCPVTSPRDSATLPLDRTADRVSGPWSSRGLTYDGPGARVRPGRELVRPSTAGRFESGFRPSYLRAIPSFAAQLWIN